MQRLINWFRKLLIRWILADIEARVTDLERHFVTARDEHGKPIQTLADVPVHQRKNLNQKPRGLSGPQLLKWLEATDGGRLVQKQERVG